MLGVQGSSLLRQQPNEPRVRGLLLHAGGSLSVHRREQQHQQEALYPGETGVFSSGEQCDVQFPPPDGEGLGAGVAEGLVRDPRERASGAVHLRSSTGREGPAQPPPDRVRSVSPRGQRPPGPTPRLQDLPEPPGPVLQR